VNRIFNAARGALEDAGVFIGLGVFVAVLEFCRRAAYRARRRRDRITIKFGHDFASAKNAAIMFEVG
jgi:hypothetical protein